MKKVLIVVSILLIMSSQVISTAEQMPNFINFILRYNTLVADQLPKIDSLKDPLVTNGADTYTIMLNKNVAMNVRINSGTLDITEVQVISSGDGSLTSGMNIMLTLGSIFGAYGFFDQLDQSADFLKQIGMTDPDSLSGKKNTYNITGHEISYAQVKNVGLMVLIIPPKK